LTSTKKYPLIKYTSRDFNSIRQDLIDYAKRYYSDTFKDFNEAGFGSLMIDSVSYIGDILSFYLDYNVNESFLDTALEFENILKIGRQLGYKFPGNPAAFGQVELYIIVPALATGIGPDPRYLPFLKRGTTFSSINGSSYALTENINFNDEKNEVVVARANSTTGAPISYAVKTAGQVISGIIDEEEVVVGNFEKFLNIELQATNITEIVSVTDAEGNEYYEVDHLTQDVVYTATVNRGSDNTVTQSKMVPLVVPRRFTAIRDRNLTSLQFGFGTMVDSDSVEPLIDPSKIVVKQHGKDYFTATGFDPTNLLKTDKLGVVPSNTTLTVTYRVNDSTNVNATANTITNVSSPIFEFADEVSLNAGEVTNVIASLEVNNNEPIVGSITTPTSEELKNRIFGAYSSQSRAVTESDYKILCYSMPAQFGAIKRVNVNRDPTSLKRNLNLYVLSEDAFGNLTAANSTIKENLKTWLNSNRMINDTIDILDGKIINIGIEYTAIAGLDANKYDLLEEANLRLVDFYNKKMELGDPFYITDVFNQINKLEGIIDVSRVKITHKTGANYSDQAFNIDDSYSDDGRYLIAPANAVFEIKFPDTDIKGTIK
jgi:hypothetical protein